MSRTSNRGKAPSQRQLRVGEIVRHALMQLLQRGAVDDPLLAKTVISVSEVSMSPDLKLATAYIMPLGDSKKSDEIAVLLNGHAKFIRGRLTPHLKQMKFMPEIRFRPDTGFDNYSKIDALLNTAAVVRDLDVEGDQ